MLLSSVRYAPFLHRAASPGGQLRAAFTRRSASILIVGDGDLSYGRYFVEENGGDDVTVSVLETREKHREVYQMHEDHTNAINSKGGKVMFGVDATALKDSFQNGKTFNHIVWNFPHWPGKTNIKRNRELLGAFFNNSRDFLAEDGEIKVALVEGQGGMGSESMRDWKASWKAAVYAAENDLLLTEIEEFSEASSYEQSSHRGVDRGFHIGKRPERYVFTPSTGYRGGDVAEGARLATFHELHVVGRRCLDEVDELASAVVEDGVNVHVMIVEWLEEIDITVFRIVYEGAKMCVTKEKGDSWSEKLEERAEEKGFDLRPEKKGRGCSHAVPYTMCAARFGLTTT